MHHSFMNLHLLPQGSRWALATVLLCACDPNRSATNSPPSVGTAAPALVGLDLDGQPFDLSTLTGKVVVVDFWASWCEPCEEAMPELAALATEFDERVVVIGVSVDDDPASMRAFVERVGVPFEIVHDHDHAIATRWAPPKMPTTFVVDAAGVIAAVHDGYESSTAAQLRSELTLLTGSPAN